MAYARLAPAGEPGLSDRLRHELSTVTKAAQRVAALGLVDASLALPWASGLFSSAIGALGIKQSKGEDFMLYRPSSKPEALLILCHPSEGQSLCRAMAEIWEEELRRAGVNFKRVDLNGSSTLNLSGADDLRAALSYNTGTIPKDVAELQEQVEASQFLIFVHPIFWFEVPSQLKAFLESVLSSGFAYRKLPSCWTLNRAVGIMNKVPALGPFLRRYSAYGLLRDKKVFIARTQGGPAAGLGIFGHGATSLESTMLFCGARVQAVDTVSEVDDETRETLSATALPQLRRKVVEHCRSIKAAGETVATARKDT
mmetsp:Transcript_63264/g.137632  ORF Transcript_63264/g.137632 Transcript_63264/m.137632 type:complete len:312 (+) Transcript_63264:34-969(+)